MSYLVWAWKSKNGKSENDLRENESYEEAKDFANWKASQLKRLGYEFDVRIYQLVE